MTDDSICLTWQPQSLYIKVLMNNRAAFIAWQNLSCKAVSVTKVKWYKGRCFYLFVYVILSQVYRKTACVLCKQQVVVNLLVENWYRLIKHWCDSYRCCMSADKWSHRVAAVGGAKHLVVCQSGTHTSQTICKNVTVLDVHCVWKMTLI